MVYGMTAFTFRLEQILDEWANGDFRVPVMVSEFNLHRFPRPERPQGMVRMWDIVRQHPDYVLGGAVYAWTTRGIETTDVDFGMVDANNQPVDGALAALTARFRAAAGGR
jgi:hypothetical protein